MLGNPLRLTDPSGMQAGSPLGAVNPTGSWYKAGGQAVYVKYGDPIGSNYQLITETNRWSRGTPVYSGAGLNEFHAVRLHPNGPREPQPTVDVRTGQAGYEHLSDFERNGWEVIWSDRIIEANPGVRDVSLETVFAAQGAASLLRSGAALTFSSIATRGSSTLAAFGSDAAVMENSANLIPKKGWFDAVVHGTRDGQNFTIGEKVVTPNAFYDMMLQKGYQPGTNIRLVSCFAGKCPNGAAQQISNLGGAKVAAANDEVFVGNGAVFDRGKQYVKNGGRINLFFPNGF